MPASSLLYAYWSLGFTGHVQEAVIWCVLCSATSLISADDPQSSLQDPSLTNIADLYLSAASMWVSEVFLDESGRIYMGFVNWVVVILPGGWQPVDFTV